jgi:hypothetical protein
MEFTRYIDKYGQIRKPLAVLQNISSNHHLKLRTILVNNPQNTSFHEGNTESVDDKNINFQVILENIQVLYVCEVLEKSYLGD